MGKTYLIILDDKKTKFNIHDLMGAIVTGTI